MALARKGGPVIVSNGKERLEIDPSDLKMAEADGFHEVPGPASKHSPQQLAVESTIPPKPPSSAEMAGARTASAAPPSRVKDIRPSSNDALNEEPAPEPDAVDPRTSLGAAARGAVQGGTLGFGEELGAGVVSAGDAIARKLHPRAAAPIEGHLDQESADAAASKAAPTISDTYRGLRDSLRADNATAQREHPLEYGGAQLATGTLTPVPGGAAMRGASLAKKIGVGTLQGAGIGTVMGAGQSEAPSWGGVVADAGKGALLGAPTGALGGGAAHGLEKLGPHFANKAGERAVQAVGARAGIKDRLAAMGVSPDEVSAMGNKFLDAGLVPSGLGFGNPQAASLARAQSLMKKSGSRVGELLAGSDAAAEQRVKDAADAFAAGQRAPVGPAGDAARAEAAKALKLPSLRFNYADAADATSRPLSNLSAAADDAAGKARGLVDQVQRQGVKTPGSYQGANQLKSDAYKSVNWANEAPIASQIHRKAASGLRQSIEDQVGNALGAPAGAELKAANSNFGTAADAEQLATRALSRDVQKQQFSPLRAMVSAAAGAGVGSAAGPAGAGFGTVLAPLVTNAIASRGPNVAAHANRLASMAAPALAPGASKLGAFLGANHAPEGRLSPPREPDAAQPAAPVTSASVLDALKSIRARNQPADTRPASVEVHAGEPLISSRSGVPTDSNGDTHEEILARVARQDEEDRAKEEAARRRMLLAKRFGAASLGDEDYSVQR